MSDARYKEAEQAREFTHRWVHSWNSYFPFKECLAFSKDLRLSARLSGNARGGGSEH